MLLLPLPRVLVLGSRTVIFQLWLLLQSLLGLGGGHTRIRFPRSPSYLNTCCTLGFAGFIWIYAPLKQRSCYKLLHEPQRVHMYKTHRVLGYNICRHTRLYQIMSCGSGSYPWGCTSGLGSLSQKGNGIVRASLEGLRSRMYSTALCRVDRERTQSPTMTYIGCIKSFPNSGPCAILSFMRLSAYCTVHQSYLHAVCAAAIRSNSCILTDRDIR